MALEKDEARNKNVEKVGKENKVGSLIYMENNTQPNKQETWAYM